MAFEAISEMSGKDVFQQVWPSALKEVAITLGVAFVVYMLSGVQWVGVGLFALFVLFNALPVLFTALMTAFALAVTPFTLYGAITGARGSGSVEDEVYLAAGNVVRVLEAVVSLALIYALYLAVFKVAH